MCKSSLLFEMIDIYRAEEPQPYFTCNIFDLVLVLMLYCVRL